MTEREWLMHAAKAVGILRVLCRNSGLQLGADTCTNLMMKIPPRLKAQLRKETAEWLNDPEAGARMAKRMYP